VATHCDSAGPDTCWTYYCITAHTGQIGQHYDSPVERGYSVDNLGMLRRPRPRNAPHSSDSDPAGPLRTRLEVPEPNPTDEGFVIRFELGGPDWVRLEVFDVMGRRVGVLREGYTDAGPHSVVWESGASAERALSPGLYFVRLVTSYGVYTAKLVLIE
jgi:hypothetical protein